MVNNFFSHSSTEVSGRRQIQCLLSGTATPYTTGDEQSRATAQATANAAQNALVQTMIGAGFLKVNATSRYTLEELQVAYRQYQESLEE